MTSDTSLPKGSAKASVGPGLAAFLDGLIDYAGLFPPARLPLDEAVSSFAAYRHSPEAWMLGRFICPATRLANLRAFTDLFAPDDPVPFAVLGTGGTDADEFLRAFKDDIGATSAFLADHEGRVTADVFEVRLPDSVFDAAPSSIAGLLERMAAALDGTDVRFERIYLEVPFAGDWRRMFVEALGVMARPPAGLRFGLKIRCGGLTPDAFPTPEQLAFVLVRCRDVRLPFKATAGLHHPVRHHDRELEVMRHGFLNVFGGGVLAQALDLTEPALRQVLRCEHLRSFTFDEAGFAFQDLRISPDQLEHARRTFAHSFGSCSFDEPREDLRAAGIL